MRNSQDSTSPRPQHTRSHQALAGLSQRGAQPSLVGKKEKPLSSILTQVDNSLVLFLKILYSGLPQLRGAEWGLAKFRAGQSPITQMALCQALSQAHHTPAFPGPLAVVQGGGLRWNSRSRDHAHARESAPPRVQGKASCKQGEAAGDKPWKRATLCNQRPCPVGVSCHEWRFFQGHLLLAKVREITGLVCAGASPCLPHRNSLEPQNQKSSSSPLYRRRN